MAARAHLVERDGEILDWPGRLRGAHVVATQILAFRIVGAPLAGFLADDQAPLPLSRDREHRVAARGYVLAAEREVRVGHEGRRFVGSGAPHLAVRNQASVDLAALGAGTGVVHLDRFAVGELALRARGRTRTRFIAARLSSGDDGE